MKMHNAGLVGFILLALATAPAYADTFTASGTAGSDGRAENAKAVFTINASSISVTLTNTAGVGQLGGVSSELDGIVFTLTGGSPTGFTTLAGTAAGGLDCTGGTATCTSVTPPASPFGWVLSGTATSLSLQAGGSSLKPEAIVDSNVTGNTDGVSNSEHNPLLLGPVTFTFDFTGTEPTSISSVTFEFGTSGDTQTGTSCTTNCGGGGGGSPVPEPSSVLMLGTAGLGIVVALKRRFGNGMQS